MHSFGCCDALRNERREHSNSAACDRACFIRSATELGQIGVRGLAPSRRTSAASRATAPAAPKRPRQTHRVPPHTQQARSRPARGARSPPAPPRDADYPSWPLSVEVPPHSHSNESQRPRWPCGPRSWWPEIEITGPLFLCSAVSTTQDEASTHCATPRDLHVRPERHAPTRRGRPGRRA